jgi:hypothetical protein
MRSFTELNQETLSPTTVLKSQAIVKLIVSAAVLCCLIAAVSSQSRRVRGPFDQFVKRLPPVDRIEVVTLEPLLNDEVKTADCKRPGLVCAPDGFPYRATSLKTLVGNEAQRMARLWRALARDTFARPNNCLLPDHELRFFKNNQLLLDTEVCSLCRQITLPRIGVVAVEETKYDPEYDLQEALTPDPSFAEQRERFKREMMPKAGQPLTVIGLITRGKGGLTIDYGEWDIELNNIDLARVNELNNLGCHTAVKVAGILQYYEPLPATSPLTQQRLPAHLYFDKPQIEVLRVEGRWK